MKTEDTAEIPSPDVVERLRARVSELEEAIHQIDAGQTAEVLQGALQYKEIFDNISACMFLLDVTPDLRFKFAALNPAEEKAVGLSDADVCGKFVDDVLGEELTRKVTANYLRCVEAGTPITYDDELDLPAGRKCFHSNLIPLKNVSGRIYRIVGVCIDTTDFKRTQERALARQKLESLGMLANGIAHDFNNLVGSILALAELAQSEFTSGLPVQPELEAIKTTAIRAGEMVRELMVYSGQDEAIVEPVDLCRLVEEMLELLKISISKNARLVVDLPRDLPRILANAAQIRQVVMNLITNASEALGDGKGVISLRASQLESQCAPAAAVSAELRPRCQFRLEVSDSGCGMTPAILDRIFDPFYTTKVSGRGLGLAAVRGIISKHGGTIHVTSAPGQGSRFEILLPCIEQPQANGDRPARASDGEGKGCGTVLVVEDEEALRIAVSKLLRKRGFAVLEASNGTEGASLYRSNQRTIDVVLLDVTLPGMSGREVLQEVRRIRSDARIILASAFSKDSVLSSIGEQRPWGYIRKPYEFTELIGLLRGACPADPQSRAQAID